jgi:hypothetical protein
VSSTNRGAKGGTVKTLPQDNPTRYPDPGINENIKKLNLIWKMQDI